MSDIRISSAAGKPDRYMFVQNDRRQVWEEIISISHIFSFLALYLSCGQLQSSGSILSSAQLFDSLIKHVSLGFLGKSLIILFKNFRHIINHGNPLQPCVPSAV